LIFRFRVADVASEVEALLDAGRSALHQGAWAEAEGTFRTVLALEELPEALAGLGEALWWLGETEEAVRCLERAYAAFRRRPDPVQAALAAIPLYLIYRVSLGNSTASRGWLGRAARLVEDFGLEPLAGWILLIRAHDTDDPTAAAEWATQAGVLARRFDDRDLELCALSQLGASLVCSGRVSEGGALLDEAMAASLSGEGDRLQTVVYTSCNMISSCSLVAEVERATQWIRAADGFTRRYGSPHLYTNCRVYYGNMLFATGDWTGAEREFEAALRMGRSAESALYGEALASFAWLRLGQGRIEEAERLLDGFEDHVTSASALAAIRVEVGETAAAAHILGRRLREIADRERNRPGPYRAGAAPRLEEALLLDLLVTAQLAQEAAGEALATARRLEKLAAEAGCEMIRARGERALGRVSCAGDDTPEGLEHLERALSGFSRLAMPCEAAKTRLLLAGALAVTEPDAAVIEANLALTTFGALGASREADAAAAFLRSLGVSVARSRPRDVGVLSSREREVLELLAEGLSNRELAERLFLTRKTVEHHVHSVLTKLGLRSRAEAAAYLVRQRNEPE
jgi:DNA-binding NarL/FixJ family response regulator